MAGEADLKHDLALACRVLATHDQGDAVWGHVSGRVPGADRFWMKPAWLGLDEVTEDDLILLDLEGNVVGGKRQRHTEWPIHAEVLRARRDVLSVVHTHPKFSIALAARGSPLRPVSHDACYFWPPEVPVFDEFTELVRTPEQGRAVARRLGDARAIFLRNHGIVVPGRTVAEACFAAVLLERAAEIQLLAQPSRDAPVEHTGEAEALVKREQIYTEKSIRAAFDYYARVLSE